MQVLLESNAACSRFVVAAASLHSLIGGRQCCHDLFSGSAIERASVARPIFRRHNMRIGHALTVISNSSITPDITTTIFAPCSATHALPPPC